MLKNMEASNDTKSEVKQWLEKVLSKEYAKITSVNILGNTEKGDNFIGDVIFVDVTGVTIDNTTRKDSLVLKCSKRSELLREKTPIKSVYLNEIFIYETVFPSFTQFQLKAGVQDIFDNVPKCYGTFIEKNMEVIVFENLKKHGYYLWEKKKPMPRKYINMVISTYGKLHATGAAMINQQPEVFDKWRETFDKVFNNFKSEDGGRMFDKAIEDVHKILTGDIDEETLQKWSDLKGKAVQILTEITDEFAGLQVVVHGDCWNNNFMFQSDSDLVDLPTNVIVLDWQLSRLSTPVIDLAYFLFTCISEDELENLNSILDYYYESFTKHLKELGSDPEVVYPKEQFLDEWWKYSKVGLLFCSTTLKLCVIDKDEAPDMVEIIEDGGHFADTFSFDIKDPKKFRDRIRPIVKYAAENGII